MQDRGFLFLTGGAGMVGRNIREHPSARHWLILAPDSGSLDLTAKDAVDKYMTAHRPSVVIHAAGRVGGIQANMASPVAFLEENMAMGHNVITAARRAGVRRLLNLGSTCMYPRAAENPLREETILTGPLEPTNEGYALAKIMAMRLCEYIRREDPTAYYKTLIPCNLYGLHDKFDPRHSHLVAAIIHKIHTAKCNQAKTVEIWGDGTAKREFMFASDLADAVWRAVETIEALPGEMNVGLGHDRSINDYYASVAEVAGWQGTFTHDLDKPVGLTRKLCSTERQSAWGWKATTTLRDGIAQTYRHYLQRHAT